NDLWKYIPGNQPPVAKAGNDTTITLPINNISVNGTGSYDPDGTITSYKWSKISGPSQYRIINPDSAKASVIGLVQGTYTFRLMVIDDAGDTAVDEISIIVNPNPSNIPPVASAWDDRYIHTTSVTLNAWGSYDPDGYIAQFEWKKIAGPASFEILYAGSSTPVLSNLVTGVYTMELTVTDNEGSTGKDTTNINVILPGEGNPNNLPPIASAGPDFSIT